MPLTATQLDALGVPAENHTSVRASGVSLDALRLCARAEQLGYPDAAYLTGFLRGACCHGEGVDARARHLADFGEEEPDSARVSDDDRDLGLTDDPPLSVREACRKVLFAACAWADASLTADVVGTSDAEMLAGLHEACLALARAQDHARP